DSFGRAGHLSRRRDRSRRPGYRVGSSCPYTGPRNRNRIARRVGGSPVQGRRCPATVRPIHHSGSPSQNARRRTLTTRLRARGAGHFVRTPPRTVAPLVARPEEVRLMLKISRRTLFAALG